MIIIACLDDHNGILFNNRRQSKDSRLRERMLEVCGEGPLWMNAYSAAQFSEAAPNIRVAENFLEKAGPGEYCFVENSDLTGVSNQAEGLVLYRWNRTYPSNVKFPIELFSYKWQLMSKVDFEGSSHERITQEVYVL